MNAPQRVSVLIVDDQSKFLTVASTVVRRTPGFELVGTAADGAEAIAQVTSLQPELVLMDIHMPVLDGIGAARRISVERPATVVILLSTYDKADLPDEFVGSGAADYLHKEELEPSALQTLWELHGQVERSS